MSNYSLPPSRVDFSTCYTRCSALHILVSAIGTVNDGFINELTLELDKIPLPNSRSLQARYVLHSTPLLSDWSDMQYYRRHLGLLCITQIENSDDPAIGNILTNYDRVKRRQESTVIDSRCIIFSKAPLMLPPDCLRPDIMVIQYDGTASSVQCEELTAILGEFTQGLYSVIVRNTIEISGEKYNASSNVQLLYSPHERSKAGLEEGKTGKRRIQGRHRKHLGDLYMLIGKPEKAIEAYDDALKILTGITDNVWVGAAYEGQACAVARIIADDKTSNPSLMIPKHDKRRSSQDSLNSLSSEPDLKSEDNLIGKFRSALIAYDKTSDASYVMLECTLKFIRLMIEFDNKREVNDLMNMDIFIAFVDLNPVERVQLFCTVATLYRDIKMIRKYCYYLRSAAIEAMNDKSMARAYTLSRSLFCEIIEKYGVNPSEKRAIGCPRIQKRALEDLISTSEKLADSSILVKYGLCLLQNFYYCLSQDDQQRIMSLIKKNNSSLGNHVIETTIIPTCKKAIVKPIDAFLQPKTVFKPDSVFIFAPKTTKEKEQRAEIWWVCGEYGEVQLRLENPLHYTLELSNMRCVMEGSDTDSYPGRVTIEPGNTVDLVLAVRPLKPTSSLHLTGVNFLLAGVPCHFRVDAACTIKVAPAMPLLSVQGSVPPSATYYEGETTQFRCTVINNSGYTINKLDIIKSKVSERFRCHPIALPLAPNSCTDFVVDVDTKVRQDQRCRCFESEDRGWGAGAFPRQRRGTIYENSSGDEETGKEKGIAGTAAALTVRKRFKTPNQVFIEEVFGLSLRYYDDKEEYFRETPIQFNVQILLLYRLEEYSIVPHPTDSTACTWHLALTSTCPERVSLAVAGVDHVLEPGERLSTSTVLERITAPVQGVPTVPCKVPHSELLPDTCVLLHWNIRDHVGRVDLMEAVSVLDLGDVFREDVRLECIVLNVPRHPCPDEKEDGATEDESIYQVPPCRPIILRVTLTNTSALVLRDVFTFLRAFHKAQHRTLHDVPFSGSRDFEVEELGPGEKMEHEFSILPLTSGTFVVEIGSCIIPPRYPLTSCVISGEGQRCDSAATVHDDDVVVLRKAVVSNLNEGQHPPAYVKSWRMRPDICFNVLSQ